MSLFFYTFRVSVSTLRLEEDFPRGGEDVITPLERRGLHYQAQQDVLFGKVGYIWKGQKLLILMR